MKKTLLFIAMIISIIAFNGCNRGNHSDSNVDYSNYDSNNLTTLFLVDEYGYAYADIPYKCDSMRNWSHTASNGEFSFIEPDNCEFDFTGLNGLYGDNFDDIVRIVDYTNDGKGGIPYDCASFGVSSTYADGSFDYDEDDVCTFYL